MISSGSSKDFCICCSYDISIGMEWIPRSQIDRADFLSEGRTYDADDSFFCTELTQLGVLIRLIVSQIIWTLNSRDSIADFGIGLLKALMLLLGLGGENNYVCWPICLILRLLFYQRNCKL